MLATTSQTRLIKALPHAKIFQVEEQSILIVEATAAYIPFESFKEIFREIGKTVKARGIEKLIFDKRKLTTFHQPSMEWYFTEWKDEMYGFGLKKHRKILPDDALFHHSVKIGRDKINQAYPHATFHKLDIRYVNSIEEGIRK